MRKTGVHELIVHALWRGVKHSDSCHGSSECSCGQEELVKKLQEFVNEVEKRDQFADLVMMARGVIEPALWSPASGPVQWDEAKISGAREQASHMSEGVVKALFAECGPEANVITVIEDEGESPYCDCGSCGEIGCGCTHKCKYAFEHPDVDEKIESLLAALHDSINQPKGVVPKSAEPFYDQTRYNRS